MLPDFVIVGAAKSGTTSIYHYLRQHPEVFLPDHKDSFFLSGTGNIRKLEQLDLKPFSFQDYSNSFKGSEDKKWKAVGDVDASCLYCHEDAIKNIKKYLNDPKIIIILRKPDERAYSNYMMRKIRGSETREFRQALIDEATESFRPYLQSGVYTDQIKPYLNNFSKVKIYLYDDLEADSVALMQDIFSFIGVDPAFRPDTSKRHNISGAPKIKLINSLYLNEHLRKALQRFTGFLGINKAVKRMGMNIHDKNLEKSTMKEEDRKYLLDYYRADILNLQKLVQRDLSHWLR